MLLNVPRTRCNFADFSQSQSGMNMDTLQLENEPGTTGNADSHFCDSEILESPFGVSDF